MKITDLPQASTPLNSGDVVAVVQNGVMKQVAQQQLGGLAADITPGELPIATNLQVGAVKSDGSTTTIAPDGTITSHATVTGSTVTGTPLSGELAAFSGAASITNADLAGDVTTAGALTTSVVKVRGETVVGTTGTTNVVFSTSPTLVTPNLGTPSAITLTNANGTAAGLTAGTCTTVPTLAGDISNVGNNLTVAEIQGHAVEGVTGTLNVVFDHSPTIVSPVLVTPDLGTPSAAVLTNATGTAAGLTAGHVTTNANLTGMVTSVGNAATVVTNANLTGDVTSAGNATTIKSSVALAGNPTTTTQLASDNSTRLATTAYVQTALSAGGDGTVTTSGTPATGNLTKFSTGTAITNGDLSGDITTSGTLVTTVAKIAGTTVSGTTGSTNAVFSNSPTLVTPVLGAASATSLATSAASPFLLTNGQLATIALTSQTVGGTTLTIPDFASVADEFTFKTKAQTMSNKTFVAPALGTPASGVLTNCSGTAASLTAGNVTTNANLTGVITSSGNATSIASQTGTGTKFVVDTSPTLVTPVLGVASATSLATSAASPLLLTNGQLATIALTSQTVGGTTLTIPDFASVNDEFTFKTKAQTMSNKTFVAPALGTPASGTLTNCTFPTLNQNTTGSAASLSVSGQTGLLTVIGLASVNRAKTVRDAADTILELGGSYTPTGTWTSLTMVTPVLGTPTSGTLTNCTFPTLNQNTTGSAASLSVSGQTGLITFAGTASTSRIKTVRDAADTILELGGSYTPTGTWTSLTMVTPVLGTPTSGTLTNCDGTAASLTAGHVTTNANMTGDVTSSGSNATTVVNVAGRTVANTAVTVTSNAGTCPVTTLLDTFTNSSAAAMTITIATSGATDGQRKIVRIYDASAVAKGITWVNTENSTITIPATSNGSTSLPLTVGLMYNSATSLWRCVASA